MIVRFLLLAVLMLAPVQPSDAACFLFFCAPHWHYHHHGRYHHVTHARRKIIKKIIVVHDRGPRAPPIDRTPITPLK